MDGGAWWAAVHGVAKRRTRLSDFPFTFHFHALEKEMATHSSVLAWRIPGMGEPGGLPSMGSHRVGHDWSDLAAAAGGKVWVTRLSLFPLQILNSYALFNNVKHVFFCNLKPVITYCEQNCESSYLLVFINLFNHFLFCQLFFPPFSFPARCLWF